MKRYEQILLVDDETFVLSALRRELKNDFAVIHTANGAQSALDILEQFPISVVITDYRMPHMSGSDLVVEVNRRFPHIVTIILSGQADVRGISKALNEGHLYRFVEKPWAKEELLSVLFASLHESENRLESDPLTGASSRARLAQRIQQSDLSKFAFLNIDITNISALNVDLSVTKVNTLLATLSEHIRGLGICDDFYRHGGHFYLLLPLDQHLHASINALSTLLATEPLSHCQFHLLLSDASHIKLDRFSTDLVVNSAGFACIASNSDSFRFEVSLDHDCYRVYALSCGIDKEELFPVFQPQLSLENDKICGWEALVRWRDHKGELFQPSEFMPIIEKYHMLEVVTKVMLNQVLQCLSTCSARFLHQHIAINVSGKMLANGCFRGMLTSSFAQHRSLFSKLFIEITETDVISDFKAAKEELAALRELGIHCALDDFGTGYSGFETICELPIDVLKIDGRYVRDLESRPSMEVILKSMIDSAHSLGMTVVAEWVEKDKQKEVLKSLGCDAIQGHLVSEALDCQALSHLVVDGV